MSTPLIELVDLWKTYDTGEVAVDALRGVDLVVERGDYLARKPAQGHRRGPHPDERQLPRALEMLTERGILCKVNSVMIPGINDQHLVVNRAVKSRGAFLHNIMPLISSPEHGTVFGLNGQRGPTAQELKALQDSCSGEMNMMRHCRQCRADAVGLLGEDRSAEFTTDKTETLSGLFDTSRRPMARMRARKAGWESGWRWRKDSSNCMAARSRPTAPAQAAAAGSGSTCRWHRTRVRTSRPTAASDAPTRPERTDACTSLTTIATAPTRSRCCCKLNGPRRARGVRGRVRAGGRPGVPAGGRDPRHRPAGPGRLRRRAGAALAGPALSGCSSWRHRMGAGRRSQARRWRRASIAT